MAAPAPKLYYLHKLFRLYLEPKEIINRFHVGIFTEVANQIRNEDGKTDADRHNRVDIFMKWFENYNPSVGNKFQELADVLDSDDQHKWLSPLLNDRKNLDDDFLMCFEKLQKPKKVKKILRIFLEPLSDICHAEDIIRHMTAFVTESDREEIGKVLEVKPNRYAVFVLLNKLISKKPVWIEPFIQAVEKLNYSAASRMFEDTDYHTLGEALRDYFGAFNTDEVEEEPMETAEYPEVMMESAPKYRRTEISLAKESEEVQKDDLKSENDKLEEMNLNKEKVKGLQAILRSYQHELSKKALNEENVVICAPTGSGKTVVAAHIIEEHLKNGNDKKVLFFAPTGGLAVQQFGKIQDYLPDAKHKIALLHGSMKSERMADFKRDIYSHDIIVMTPKILLNCLENRKVKSLFDFSLMVFDECHHARASHPYSEILRIYLEEKTKDKTIQIIGLTATLGIGQSDNSEDAIKHIFKLLGMLDATGGISIAKDHEDELNELCPTPMEETKYIAPNDSGEDPFKQTILVVADKVKQILAEKEAFTKFNFPLPNGAGINLNKVFEGWCQKLRHAAESKVDSHEEESPTLGRDTMKCCETLMCLIRAHDLCDNCQPSDAIEKIIEFDKKRFVEQNEKNTDVENCLHELLDDTVKQLNEHVSGSQSKVLLFLEDKIKQKQEEDADFRCMIMVNRRLYAACIRKWAEETALLKDLGCDMFIGVGTKSTSEMQGMTHKKQSEVLKRFDKGEKRLMVCTPDAAGEGIDIQDCNLVVTVDCVKNEISKVQLTGRARKEDSEVIHVYFGSKDTERDELPKKKQRLMESAIEEIERMQNLNNKQYQQLLTEGREEATKQMKAAEEKKKNSPLPQPGRRDSFLCRTCSTRICYTDSIIRLNGNHHTVNDTQFRKKYSRRKHYSRGEMCGKTDMRHVNRICCDNCKCDWGNEVAWKGYLMPVIGIKGFKIQDRRGKVHTPSKWKNTRLRIPDRTSIKDLHSLLFEKCQPEDIVSNEDSEETSEQSENS